VQREGLLLMRQPGGDCPRRHFQGKLRSGRDGVPHSVNKDALIADGAVDDYKVGLWRNGALECAVEFLPGRLAIGVEAPIGAAAFGLGRYAAKHIAQFSDIAFQTCEPVFVGVGRCGFLRRHRANDFEVVVLARYSVR